MQAMFDESGKAGSALLMNHLYIVVFTIILSVVVTAVLAFAIKAVIGLRVPEEAEQIGLDLADHGEDGYHTAG
jgi:Amt family ammonium transporter